MKKCRRGNGTDKTVSQYIHKLYHWVEILTHVDSQFPEIRVELTREPQASCDTRHNNGNKMVEIAVRRRRELECPEADIVQSFIINAECFIGILHQLVDRKRGVVGLSNDRSDNKWVMK